MHRSFLEVLVCPACLDPLVPSAPDEQLTEGVLACRGCSRDYDVSHGLPFLMLRGEHWGQTREEVEGEQEFVNELPVSEHVKRNRFETGRTLRLLDNVSIPPNPLVLDLGGSSGLGAALFARYGARVVVTDIVPFLLKVGETFLKDRLPAHFAVSKMESLPFASNQFDVVFCRQALHHSPDPATSIREMFRTVKPGGWVLIASEPCLSWADLLSHRYARWRGFETAWMKHPILAKLPDDQFLAVWPDYRRWISRATSDFRIEPAGGSAATIPTPEGLRFVTDHRERRFWGKLQEFLLPGNRGFRGDLNIIARKTQPVERLEGLPDQPPVRAADFSVGEFSPQEIEELRSVMEPMLEPSSD